MFQPGELFSVLEDQNIDRLDQLTSGHVVEVNAAPRVFQVIDTGLLRKKHVGTLLMDRLKSVACPATVQNYIVWNYQKSISSDQNVFAEGSPELVDLSASISWTSATKHLRSWTHLGSRTWKVAGHWATVS